MKKEIVLPPGFVEGGVQGTDCKHESRQPGCLTCANTVILALRVAQRALMTHLSKRPQSSITVNIKRIKP